MSLNTYLFFDGNCAQAFDFYKSVFGGEFMMRSTFDEAPSELEFAESEKDKIMHVSLPVGESVLMGSDMADGFGEKTAPGGFAISYRPDSKEDADRIFALLTDGGSVVMPMQDTFWGSYFGQGADKFGVRWMVNVALSAE